MSCGNIIGDKWRYYQKKVKDLKLKAGQEPTTRPIMIDGTSVPDTIENVVLKEIGFIRPCCKKHFLTHRDLIEHI